MSRLFSPRGRDLVIALFICLLTVPASSQVKLRDALDYDADGKADFSIFRPSTNTWWAKYSGSSGYLRQQWGLANEDRLVPGDYDGDHQADIAVYRDTTSVWWILDTTDFTHKAIKWGIDGDEPVARDYDGDGKTDLAIARRSGGLIYWWIRFTSGGHIAAQWGLDSDYVCPGDYDADGRFDFCVQRPGPTPTSPSIFYVRGTTSGFTAWHWGLSSDFLVPGDYDGDGRTDIAVAREGALSTDSVTWWIRRSDGNGHFAAAFGRTGDDYFVQGDYNGDGRTEIATWRQSDGTFRTLDLMSGARTQYTWGIPGDLPLASYDTH